MQMSSVDSSGSACANEGSVVATRLQAVSSKILDLLFLLHTFDPKFIGVGFSQSGSGEKLRMF